MNRLLMQWWAKPLIFALSLLPAVWLAWQVVQSFLGGGGPVNPVEYLIRGAGDWALRFLLLTLAVRPAARLLTWPALMRFRRMIGLFAFFYAALHLLSWVGVDQTFDWPAIGREIVKRKFITIGMLAFTLLVPLAVTSTNKMIRRLGAKRWQALHRLIYPIGLLGVVHYYMMVKADVRQPLIYAAIVAALLIWRWRPHFRRKAAA